MSATTEQYQLFELLAKAGWVIWPLAFCSLIGVAIIVERLISGPRRSRVIPPKFRSDLEELAAERRFDEIAGLCRADNSPLAKVILAGLRFADRPREEIKEAVERAGRIEAAKMQRFIGALGTIAAVTPLLGLLGTVSGMINTFEVIQLEGVGNAAALSGGISEALLSTACGLTIAIPCLVFHRMFLARCRELTLRMEQIAAEFVESMQKARLTDKPAPKPVLSRAEAAS
ncbi:MAG: MotA/TolQ/ExbB proton channel family protein [Bdellovibrionales bacterium]|nr:MotA/TolQ/ExbB proton channel family protein [Bdellovibrionales bacterium]